MTNHDRADGESAAEAAATTVLGIGYLNAAREALDTLSGSGRTFTADDLHDHVGSETSAWLDDHPSVLGALFHRVSDQRRIAHVGWTDSRRRPGRPQRVWACGRGASA